MDIQGTAIVTGGAGFIGSHLCDALLAENFRVLAVDNLVTGNENNLLQAKSHPNFDFLNQDVTQKIEPAYQVTHIFHFASPASVVDYQNLPEETALVNSEGTRQLLILAKEHNARLLFASTSEIYGDPMVHPQPETYWGNVNPNGVRACYDESKRFGEMITMLYHRLYQVDSRIIRIFNTYGPRMRPDDGRVISNFINQALKKDPVTIYGTGNQTRSFCYVSDLVAGILKVMFFDAAKGDVYNLGNPEEYTMQEVAEKILQMTGSESQIGYHPLPTDDPEKRRPDITKATTFLGWKPTVTLEQGLKDTIAYYQSLL